MAAERLGGQTERGRKNFIAESNSIDAELEAKREAERLDLMDHNRRSNRLAINRLMTLIERHDMRPNK